jgi:hypothetical protein
MKKFSQILSDAYTLLSPLYTPKKEEVLELRQRLASYKLSIEDDLEKADEKDLSEQIEIDLKELQEELRLFDPETTGESYEDIISQEEENTAIIPTILDNDLEDFIEEKIEEILDGGSKEQAVKEASFIKSDNTRRYVTARILREV